MADYVMQALEMRRDALQGKLNARTGQDGFAANVIELQTAIAALDAEIAARIESAAAAEAAQPQTPPV